jgi:phage gpG-like protein
MSNIQITIDSAQVEALLSQIQGKLDHQQPLLTDIGKKLKENIRLTFTDLKTPYGVPWKPLSPVTKYQRAKRVSGGRVYRKDGKGTLAKFTQTYLSATPLNDTGVLRNSIAYQLSGQAVEIGTNAPQAAMMNFGAKQGAFGKNKRNTPIPWGDIPARQFMPVDPLPVKWEQEVIVIVEDYLGIV